MNITVLGAGAYGLALALTFYKNNNNVTVWTKIESEKEEIISTRKNEKALPGVIIPEEINITTDISCIEKSELIVLAIPVNFFRSTCLEIKDYVNDSTLFLIATKGIENKTSAFCHEILKSTIDTNHISAISGPTFAIELANDSKSGLTLASNNIEEFNIIKKALENNNLKIEKSIDLIGTEICGSVKNIMAIISGMLKGLKTTETTKALFLTTALQEIKNIILSLNGNIETIDNLCGIGDLILTCSSDKSRNFTLGNLLATSSKDEVLEYLNNNTVEGYYTLISIYSLIKEKNINAPLINTIYQILFQEKNKEEIFNVLISN